MGCSVLTVRVSSSTTVILRRPAIARAEGFVPPMRFEAAATASAITGVPSERKRFDQVARGVERRDAAEDARAQNLRPRSPGQKAALGFGIGGGNGEDVSGMERRVEIAEEIGEAAGARERDGAWPLAIAHAIHAAQADAPARGRAVGKSVRHSVRQTPTASPVEVGVTVLAPVAAAQANRKSQSVVALRARLRERRRRVGPAVTSCAHVNSFPAATPGFQGALGCAINDLECYYMTCTQSLVFRPDRYGEEFHRLWCFGSVAQKGKLGLRYACVPATGRHRTRCYPRRRPDLVTRAIAPFPRLVPGCGKGYRRGDSRPEHAFEPVSGPGADNQPRFSFSAKRNTSAARCTLSDSSRIRVAVVRQGTATWSASLASASSST